ncbi:MAG: hypothetical protein AAGC85_26515 [Bacteroidota bacterium]
MPISKDQIQQIHIQLSINEQDLLRIMLSTSGAINRMGDGSLEDSSPAFFMGRTEEPFYEELMEAFSEDWLVNTGRYEFEDRTGDTAHFSITLSSEAEETGFAFTYGTTSQGPPEELVEWVSLAVELTQEWFEEQFARKKQRRK